MGNAVSVINPAITSLLGVASGLGLNLDNPFEDGKIHLTLNDILAVAGVSDVNDLPPGTDLVSYIPAAVGNKIAQDVANVFDAVQAKVEQLGFFGTPLSAALETAKGVINPIVDCFANCIGGPLGDALTSLVQLQVNVQEHNADRSFTQTALRIGDLPNLSLIHISEPTRPY